MSGLDDYLRAASVTPFDWRSLNCWFFAADWVRAVTGGDAIETMRGRFHNRFGCLRMMLQEGERSYLGWARRRFGAIGLTEVGPGERRRGDIVAVGSVKGHFGGIATGPSGIAAKLGPGLWWGRPPGDCIATAWRVVRRDA